MVVGFVDMIVIVEVVVYNFGNLSLVLGYWWFGCSFDFLDGFECRDDWGMGESCGGYDLFENRGEKGRDYVFEFIFG